VLEAAFGVPIDSGLLRRALTHRSYAYEHGGLPTNERLEFLGDAVLGLEVRQELSLDLGHVHAGRPMRAKQPSLPGTSVPVRLAPIVR
jgi:dsRNA-specific ribonuclease